LTPVSATAVITYRVPWIAGSIIISCSNMHASVALGRADRRQIINLINYMHVPTRNIYVSSY
jgi:hypothetical protein